MDRFEEQFEKEFTEPMKKMTVPDSLRMANRTVIRQAMAQQTEVPIMPLPWYRRRISLPLSWAAIVLLVFSVQLGWIVHLTQCPTNGRIARDTTQEEFVENPVQEAQWEPQRQQESVYVAGFGTIYRSDVQVLGEI